MSERLREARREEPLLSPFTLYYYYYYYYRFTARTICTHTRARPRNLHNTTKYFLSLCMHSVKSDLLQLLLLLRPSLALLEQHQLLLVNLHLILATHMRADERFDKRGSGMHWMWFRSVIWIAFIRWDVRGIMLSYNFGSSWICGLRCSRTDRPTSSAARADL